jgi:hypothetical protein
VRTCSATRGNCRASASASASTPAPPAPTSVATSPGPFAAAIRAGDAPRSCRAASARSRAPPAAHRPHLPSPSAGSCAEPAVAPEPCTGLAGRNTWGDSGGGGGGGLEPRNAEPRPRRGWLGARGRAGEREERVRGARDAELHALRPCERRARRAGQAAQHGHLKCLPRAAQGEGGRSAGQGRAIVGRRIFGRDYLARALLG